MHPGTGAVAQLQGGNFPDHMKFPDFSSTGKQRFLPGVKFLPIWSTVIVSN